MALATKCPHCNTVFRVAHDQLKLRGGIVRCGACNEVFDGNAALVEPPLRPPVNPPVASSPAEQALELQADQVEAALADAATPADDSELPLDQEIDLDLDLDVDDELPAAASAAAHGAARTVADSPAAGNYAAGDTLDATAPQDATERREPGFDTPQEHLVAVALDELHHFDQADSAGAADATPAWAAASGAAADTADAAAANASEDEDTLHTARSVIAGGASPAAAALRASRLAPTARNGQDEDSWHQAAGSGPGSGANLASAPDAHGLLAEGEDIPTRHADAGEAAPETPARPPHAAQSASGDAAFSLDPLIETPAAAHAEEPDFIRRDRRRQQMSKAARIVMACALPLLLAGLLLQGLTTFRNSLAASVPELKPALVALCASVGCKVDYPTQIDALSVEQGELQAMTDFTFSYATVLRNQSRTTQAWPHLELILNDSADKPVLRRVFAPRDYLPAPADADKGFTARSEQTVKLYFELRQLKASGYHIAIFYP